MRISAAAIGYYRESLDQIGQQASGYVRDAVGSVGESAGVTAHREAAIASLTESVAIHGEMAQALAAQLFDEVCEAEGLGYLPFEMVDGIIDGAMVEEGVRYRARSLVDGDRDGFLDEVGQLADFYARRSNWQSMAENCRRGGVRYARVPTGNETCDWCIMLASRGFVYWSEASAEHANHLNCDCVICPGGPSTTIDGYDPNALYDQWRSSGFMPPANARGGYLAKASDRNAAAASARAAIDSASSVGELALVVDRLNATMRGQSRKTLQELQDAIYRRRKALG